MGDVKNIDVFILCGGLGTRLRKICPDIPKPMTKIGKRRLLDIIITYFSGFGFRKFILGTGYRSEVIVNYYRNHRINGSEISFSNEKVQLGTGGSVKNAEKLIKSNPFFVLNGDSICESNPVELLNFHKNKKSLISILLRKSDCAKEYGGIKIDKSRQIIDFREKGYPAKTSLINAGVYVFDRKIFSLMPRKRRFSLEYDFFPRMTAKRMFGYLSEGYFIDIGTPQRYSMAKKHFLKNKNRKARKAKGGTDARTVL